MGEYADKMKGAANKTAGELKQRSANERVREEGAAQASKGHGQELKGKVKGVINKLETASVRKGEAPPVSG